MTNRAGRRRRHRRHKARTARGPFRHEDTGPRTLLQEMKWRDDPRVRNWMRAKYRRRWDGEHWLDAIANLLAMVNPILLDMPLVPVEEPLTYRPACPRPPCQSPLP